MSEEIYEKSIEELTPPKNASQETIANVRSNKINTDMFDYPEYVKKLQDSNCLNKEKIPTFYKPLDVMLDGGFQGGELIILSAPTKSGKTLFCQTMSYNQAKNGIPSVWFTFELGWQEFTKRFMEMDPEFQSTGVPQNLPIWYPIENHSLSLEWLESQIKKSITENNAKIVFIDHLHFLLPLKDFNQNVSFLIGGIVRELKTISIRNDIPIVLIAHPKKTEVDDIMTMSAIRDSSFITQESDFTLVMWRERYPQRVNNSRRPGENVDILENKSIYKNSAIVSLEANRRNGITERFRIEHNNGRFCDLEEALVEQMNAVDPREVESSIPNEEKNSFPGVVIE
jgi:replicative DNA helicase